METSTTAPSGSRALRGLERYVSGAVACTGSSLTTGPPGEGEVDRLACRAGGVLVGLAAAHVAYFSPSSVRALDHWLAGALWTLDTEMTGVDAAFWALPGGAAVPLGLVGLLVRRQARQGTPPPAWLGWGLGAWGLIGSLISEPSGFPIIAVAGGMLVAASRRSVCGRP